MPKFELKIYGENDEIKKEFGTDIIRFGILEEAIKLSESIEGKNNIEQFKMIKPLIVSIFPGLDEEEIKNASYEDVFNLFKQIMQIANGMKSDSAPESLKKTEEE